MRIELLAPITGPGVSKEVRIRKGGAVIDGDKQVRAPVPCTLSIFPTPSTGAAIVYHSSDNGASWATHLPEGAGGVPLALDSNQNSLSWYAPVLIRVDKAATTEACGIYLEASDP